MDGVVSIQHFNLNFMYQPLDYEITRVKLFCTIYFSDMGTWKWWHGEISERDDKHNVNLSLSWPMKNNSTKYKIWWSAKDTIHLHHSWNGIDRLLDQCWKGIP